MLEVTLQIPKLMGTFAHESMSNYPIREFRWPGLEKPAYYIMREVGISGRFQTKASECLGWEYFGVRSAHYTIDLPVPNKTALLRTLANYQRSGKRRTWGDETVQWTTGGKVVQVYDKLTQLRRTLGKTSLEHVTRHHPELPQIVRVEGRLQSTDLRTLFGLPPGWLPKLAPVADPRVVQWVLQRELRQGFGFARIGAASRKGGDLIADRAQEILRQADADGGGLAFSRLCQILVAGALIEHHTKAEIVEKYGVSRAQLGKLLLWSRRLGIVPGVDANGASYSALRDMVTAYSRAYPKPLRSQPRLLDRETWSVDASWVEEPDYFRPVEGIVVEEHGVDEGDVADLTGLA